MPHVFACHAPYVDSDLFQAYCFPESFYRCQRPGPEVSSCADSLLSQCLHANLAPVPTHGNAATDVDETPVFCQYRVIRAAGVTKVVQAGTRFWDKSGPLEACWGIIAQLVELRLKFKCIQSCLVSVDNYWRLIHVITSFHRSVPFILICP